MGRYKAKGEKTLYLPVSQCGGGWEVLRLACPYKLLEVFRQNMNVLVVVGKTHLVTIGFHVEALPHALLDKTSVCYAGGHISLHGWHFTL